MNPHHMSLDYGYQFQTEAITGPLLYMDEITLFAQEKKDRNSLFHPARTNSSNTEM